MSVTRPLMSQSDAQLEALFAKVRYDTRQLKALEAELQYRVTARAKTLLLKVQGALYGPSAPGKEQPELWPGVEPEAPVPPAPPAPPAASPQRGPAAVAMSPEEAYAFLKAAPSTAWQVIEQTRRRLVQASHPAQLANLDADKRQRLQAQAARANAAYAVLSRVRTS